MPRGNNTCVTITRRAHEELRRRALAQGKTIKQVVEDLLGLRPVDLADAPQIRTAAEHELLKALEALNHENRTGQGDQDRDPGLQGREPEGRARPEDRRGDGQAGGSDQQDPGDRGTEQNFLSRFITWDDTEE